MFACYLPIPRRNNSDNPNYTPNRATPPAEEFSISRYPTKPMTLKTYKHLIPFEDMPGMRYMHPGEEWTHQCQTGMPWTSAPVKSEAGMDAMNISKPNQVIHLRSSGYVRGSAETEALPVATKSALPNVLVWLPTVAGTNESFTMTGRIDFNLTTTVLWEFMDCQSSCVWQQPQIKSQGVAGQLEWTVSDEKVNSTFPTSGKQADETW
eukprot:GHVS01000275.1.p1 GENE.GHVS01000275.1~~GHVS01000275.1.p1  ORF type:complete len:208 (+),score=8.64 GHVS01000275.1:282-905(+)